MRKTPLSFEPSESGRLADAVTLLHELAAEACETPSSADFIRSLLSRVCRFARWQVGHAFTPGAGGGVHSSGLWYFEAPGRYDRFRAATEAQRCDLRLDSICGAPLTGPLALADVAKERRFARRSAAVECGLAGYFAYPLTAGGTVTAVFEFLSGVPMRVERPLLETVAVAAGQLAHVVVRERTEAALRAAEIRFRSVVQSARDGIVLTDAAGGIASWNGAAERIFGYAEREVLGFPMELLICRPDRRAYALAVERFRVTGRSDLVGSTIVLGGRRKDGTEFPLELALASWATAEGTFFTGVIRELTEFRSAA